MEGERFSDFGETESVEEDWSSIQRQMLNFVYLPEGISNFTFSANRFLKSYLLGVSGELFVHESWSPEPLSY
jgi:hypothetical protein